MADEKFDLPSYVAVSSPSVRPEVMKSIWESRQAVLCTRTARAGPGGSIQVCLEMRKRPRDRA